METIFYVLFEGQKSFHDRIQYFEEQKTLNDFMIWMAGKRAEIEKVHGDVYVSNMKIVRN